MTPNPFSREFRQLDAEVRSGLRQFVLGAIIVVSLLALLVLLDRVLPMSSGGGCFETGWPSYGYDC